LTNTDTVLQENIARIIDHMFIDYDGKYSIEEILEKNEIRVLTNDPEVIIDSIKEFGRDCIVANDRTNVRKSPIRNVLMLSLDDLFSEKFFKNKVLQRMCKVHDGWLPVENLYALDRFKRTFKQFGEIDISHFTDLLQNCKGIEMNADRSAVKRKVSFDVLQKIAAAIDHYYSDYIYPFKKTIHEYERTTGIGIPLEALCNMQDIKEYIKGTIPVNDITNAIKTKCTFAKVVYHQGVYYVNRKRPYTQRQTRTTDNFDFCFGQLTLPANKFHIMTYNILADYLTNSDRYDYLNPKFTRWPKRRNFIVLQIGYYRPDILCLQDVQSPSELDSTNPEDHYTDLATRLGHMYSGTYKRKISASGAVKKGLDVGVATFVNTSTFTIVKTVSIELGKLLYDQCNGLASAWLFRAGYSQVALLHHLKGVWNEKELLVCNIHTCYGGNTAHIQLLQVQTFLDQVMKYLAKKKSQKIKSYIICGDFNSTPSSMVYELLSTGQLSPTSLSLLKELCINFTMPDVKWGHNLNLTSCYRDVLLQEPELTTCTAETCSTVDYIWISGLLKPNAVLDVPSKEEATREIALPNRKHPSDHIQLSALLTMKE
jgi:mRNA deadenylase 3'-5' endonuclease subunit Ccr4